MSKKKKKDIYVIKDSKIHGAIYIKKHKIKKNYCYIRTISTGEKMLINKNSIFTSLNKAEKFLDKKKISYKRYLHKKTKRKRINDRILDLEDGILWSIKAQNRNQITYQQAEEIIDKSTKKIRKLKKELK